MALVIWRVFFTLRIRRRMSKRFAITLFQLCSTRSLLQVLRLAIRARSGFRQWARASLTPASASTFRAARAGELPLAHKALLELLERFLDVGLEGVIDGLLLHDGLPHLGIHVVNVLIKVGFEVTQFLHSQLVLKTVS